MCLSSGLKDEFAEEQRENGWRRTGKAEGLPGLHGGVGVRRGAGPRPFRPVPGLCFASVGWRRTCRHLNAIAQYFDIEAKRVCFSNIEELDNYEISRNNVCCKIHFQVG